MRAGVVQFPFEHRAEIVGDAAERQDALIRILGVAIVGLVLAYLLLQAALRSWGLALIVLATLPVALGRRPDRRDDRRRCRLAGHAASACWPWPLRLKQTLSLGERVADRARPSHCPGGSRRSACGHGSSWPDRDLLARRGGCHAADHRRGSDRRTGTAAPDGDRVLGGLVTIDACSTCSWCPGCTLPGLAPAQRRRDPTRPPHRRRTRRQRVHGIGVEPGRRGVSRMIRVKRCIDRPSAVAGRRSSVDRLRRGRCGDRQPSKAAGHDLEAVGDAGVKTAHADRQGGRAAGHHHGRRQRSTGAGAGGYRLVDPVLGPALPAGRDHYRLHQPGGPLATSARRSRSRASAATGPS